MLPSHVRTTDKKTHNPFLRRVNDFLRSSVSGVLRNPDGSVIPNAKLTLKDMHFYKVFATGVSTSEGKYCFVGVPGMGFSLEVEEPGKVKRIAFIEL